jgi:DNA/RNA endonuclease G (NUC1)
LLFRNSAPVVGSTAVPGWSFRNNLALESNWDNGAASTQHLVDWNSIHTLKLPITNGDGKIQPSYLDTIGYDINKPNYALLLNPGEKITHNNFIVPEWGGLRFNIHVPEPATESDQSSFVRVVLIDENGNRHELKSTELTSWNQKPSEFPTNPILSPAPDTQLIKQRANQPPVIDDRENNIDRPAVDLREVSYLTDDLKKMESQTNRIGYGSVGFETFEVNIPKDVESQLRGKVATLEISVHGTKKIYLDDVFFKSEHLISGNPALNISGDPALNGQIGQIAVRDEANFNNYLIETPQLAISYSKDKGTANWVSYKLDRSWMNNTNLNKPDFVVDYSLPVETFDRNSNKVLNGTSYSQGHIATASHRSRTIQSYYTDATRVKYAIKKDYYLDHLMTNLLPEIEIKILGQNNPLQDFEEYLKNKLVGIYNPVTNNFDGAGKELYIISGGSGSKGQLIAPSPLTFSQLPIAYQEKMTIPEYLWKAILVLDSGQDIRDVNSNTIAFAVKIPNDISVAGTSWTNYIESIRQLENETGYIFFANLPANFQNSIKNNTSINALPPI